MTNTARVNANTATMPVQRVPSAALRLALRSLFPPEPYILTKQYERAGVCWVMLDETTGERFGRFEWADSESQAYTFACVLEERMARKGAMRLEHVYIVPNPAQRRMKASA